MGYDHTGSILQFDEDGNITGGGTKLNDVILFNFSRLLTKDEIKKGSFAMQLSVSGAYTQAGGALFSPDNRITISDQSGSTGYFVNSPVGEYGILYATASASPSQVLKSNNNFPVGLLFYQAGVAVLSSSVFIEQQKGGILKQNTSPGQTLFSGPSGSSEGIINKMTGSLIRVTADNVRNRLFNLQFNNTTELNSTIYFCRVNHNEYNYSTNPTYLSNSKIRVKTKTSDIPVSYITTIGLYNDNNELMAVAKLSEPLKKTADVEFTIRARLDY